MNLKFEFSVEELNLILEGLRELSFKRVHSTLVKIETETVAQLKPPVPVITPEPVKE